jgi:sortase B
MKRLLDFFKTRRADFWYRVIICLCLLIFAASLTKLILIFREYHTATTEYTDLESDFVVVQTEDDQEEVTGSAVETGSSVVEQTDENGKKSTFVFTPLNVDFASLKKTNKDVVGWIQFETFSLSYPIVQDSGDNYYLNHTFKKQKNSSGSIFIGPSNSSSFQDTNTVIFGHNMKNGSMFGLLGRYKEKSYFTYNQYFRIYTPNGTQRYQIFSVYKASINGSAYTIWGSTGSAEYGKWIKELKKNSMYDTGVSVSASDTIVTLSTCVSGDTEKRLVILAKRIQ